MRTIFYLLGPVCFPQPESEKLRKAHEIRKSMLNLEKRKEMCTFNFSIYQRV